MAKELTDKLVVPNEVINRILYQEILEDMPLTFDEVEKLEDYEISEEDRIGRGGEGKIYSLGESCVGKILHCSNPNSRRFYSHLLEQTICQKLAYKRGVKVPKVDGIFKIKRKEDGQFWPTLVMQKIDGKRVSDIGSPGETCYERFSKLGELEQKKAIKLGIGLSDSYDVNFIANEKKQETYLIDCSNWRFKGVNFSEIKIGEEE